MAAPVALLPSRLYLAQTFTARAGNVHLWRLYSSNSSDEKSAVDEIDKLRDISGLTTYLKKKYLKSMPAEPNPNKIRWYDPLKWRRRMYAIHGSQSGIDPAVAWPTKHELQEIVSYSKEVEPNLQSMLSKMEAEKKQNEDFLRKRMSLIDQRLKKMPQFIDEFKAKKAKRDLEATQKEEKKQKLLDEAREYYGYKIDFRDAKFQKMVEEKAAKEDAERKQQKKLLKQNRLATRLEALASGTGKAGSTAATGAGPVESGPS